MGLWLGPFAHGLGCAGGDLRRSRDYRYAVPGLVCLFYGALGLFVYLLRYIKQHMARAKQLVAGIFGGDS